MRQIDIHQAADAASFNAFHGRILLWCALIVIFDGYDLAVAGIAMPAIMKDMGVSATQAGLMASSALFGMMFGAIVLGTLSDRIGRRRVIALCIVLFSVFTAAAGLTHDPILFSLMRFLAGLGIGGVMPNVIAQISEYAPRRLRATLVTVMFSGYSIGGMLAALLGKMMLESLGWPSVFLAALAPVLLAPLILRGLPESMTYLQRTGQTEALRSVLTKLRPDLNVGPDDTFVLPERQDVARAPVAALFTHGRARSTVMFWASCFMCLFMVYALSTWLAKLMASAGYSLGSALTFVLVLNFGAMLGAVGGGWLSDRFPIQRVLVIMYLLAAGSIAVLGQALPSWALFLTVGLAGASTIGTQIVTNAYVSQFYPMAIRSTGLGWALGIGRTGAILAPVLIGALVGMNLPLQSNFLAIALPALIAAATIALVDPRRSAAHPS